jgi:hypothetical protein
MSASDIAATLERAGESVFFQVVTARWWCDHPERLKSFSITTPRRERLFATP